MKRCSQTAALFLWTLLLAFGWAGAAHAQGVTTSAVQGRVTNEQGAPVAGARVVVTHTRTGAESRVVTREDGRYLITGLQPGGPYRIQVSALGYGARTQSGVDLVLSQTARVDVQLAPEAIALEGVTATGARGEGELFSRTRTGVATTVDAQDIQALPTITRDIADFSRLVPQISTAGGGSNAAGRNSRFNNIQIDGAVNNDLFGLSTSGTPGGQTGTRPITMEAIQELQVVIAPFDVRQGGFTGAGINAVTKSGTNRFSGSATYFTRDQDLVGRYRTPGLAGASSALSPEFGTFEQRDYGFSLGGPIVRDRLHFFVAGERSDRNAPTGFVAGQQAALTNASVQRVADILRTQYGFDAGELGEMGLGRESTNLFGRLDFQVSDGHRLTLRHNFVDAYDDNLARRNDLYQLGSSLYRIDDRTNSTVAQLNSTFGSSIFNEFRVGYSTIRDKRTIPDTPFPRVQVGVSCPGSTCNVVAGSENSSIQNALDQDLLEITNDLTVGLGAHRITIGTHNEFFDFSNLFVQNVYGTYEFSDTTALKAGTPSRYQYSYLNEGGNPRAEFSVRQYAFYVQDQFDVSDRLTLTGGVRFDYTSFPETPAQNDTVLKYFGRSTAEIGGDNLSINPRLGFNWDVAGDQITQLRGGIGLFSGRTPYVWVSNAYGNTGLDYTRFTCTGNATPAFTANPSNQPRQCVGSTRAPNEINLIDPGFELPQVFRGSLAVDRRLPGDVVATFEGLYSRSLSDPVYRNLAVNENSAGTVEGRPLYSRRYSTSALPSIGDVYDVFNTDENYSYSLTGQLRKTFASGLDLTAAYTWSQAEDVNPLRSSTASSNWRFNPIDGNPNDPELRPSDWLVEHRVLVAGSYTVEYLRRAPTEFSFIYEGESGRPYGYRYDGDVNADGSNANDLVFVPASRDQIRFQGTPEQQDASWRNFNDFIESVECLREARGEVLQRNACRQPWSNRFDVRVAQTVPTFRGQRVQITLDVLNFANLLNNEWGRSDFVSNQNDPLLRLASGTNNPDAAGRYLYTPFAANRRQFTISDLSSRYQIQIGARYAF